MIRHDLARRAPSLREPSLMPAAAGRVGPRPGRDAMRDAVQPARERVLHPERPRLAGQHEERGLEGVLGGVLVAEHAPADAEDHRPVPLHQGLEGQLGAVLVPGGEPRQQLGIRQPGECAQVPQPMNLPEQPARRPAMSDPSRDSSCLPIMPGNESCLTVFPDGCAYSLNYAKRADRVVIRHGRGKVVAIIEIVSPGNKDSRNAIRTFVEKAADILNQGVNLLVVDLFPPTPRDPQGIHKAIWDEFGDEPFEAPPGKPLTVASYIGGDLPTAYVESVGRRRPAPVVADLPLGDPIHSGAARGDLHAGLGGVPGPAQRTHRPDDWLNRVHVG